MKKHIAVDLDDVCLDFMPSVFAAFEREYGIPAIYDGYPWGESAATFAKHPMFIQSGYKSWWDWLKDRDWLWSTFGVVPGAIGGVKRLRADGWYVECVTSKPEWAEYNVWKWLGKWRPAFNRVTITTNGQNKVDFTDASIIVDDKLDTCVSFALKGRIGLQFDRRPETPGGFQETNLYVVKNWDDVIYFARSLG